MILAIVLSILVLFGWQYFVAGPQMEQAAQQAEQQAQQANDSADVAAPQQDGSTAPASATSAASPAFASRDEALAASDRVTIETESLLGSINLTGARIDDLHLKNYHETVDDSSPIITLLSPAGSPNGFYVDQGWSSASDIALPDGTSEWALESGSTLGVSSPVTLTWDNGAGLMFKRTFAVDENYLFTVTQTVENSTGGDVALFGYARVVRHGIPDDLHNFFILHEGPIGVLGDANLVEKSYNDLSEEPVEQSSTGGWLGFTDKYWAATVMPSADTSIIARMSARGAPGAERFETNFIDQSAVVVPANGSASETTYVFAGAKVESIIDSYEQGLGIDRFELLIDWGWFHFLTKPMFYLIRFLYGVLGNFGLAILAVTVIVKAVFFPLANRSYASMAAMRKVQPEMKRIQEEHKDDRAKQQQAMMELYKKEKINPLSGCWPILIQIPVFFSLYKVLFVTIEMRHAPFFGWIEDLAAQDPTNVFNLFGLLPYDPTALPVIGAFLAIGIWPLIMGITMWVQMKLNPPPPDPSQAMIFNLMPILFTFMLGTFPAGLVIYWAWNNFLSIIQQGVIMKRNGAQIELWNNLKNMVSGKKKADSTE